MTGSTDFDTDIIIVGAGPNGLAAALAFARSHNGGPSVDVTLIDASDVTSPREDIRASTLAASSLVMLSKLGIGGAIAPSLCPVNDMMIGEGRVGDISPLSLHFDGTARDTAMAHVIENEVLRRALVAKVTASGSINLISGVGVQAVDNGARAAGVTLSDGRHLSAPLLVISDGRNSALRGMIGVAAARHDYGQKALTVMLRHSRAHAGVAHQLFLSGGPFAILPLTDNRVSIVWSDKTRAIDAAMALPADALLSELSRRIGDVLGDIEMITAPQSYPLTLVQAEMTRKGRAVLLGDAAHGIHPLAGQGLNLGLRDSAALADVVTQARAAGLDIGGASLIDYERWRGFDNASLASVTDALNGLFSNHIAPLRHLRRLGLASVDRIGPLRNFFIREAAGELGDLPRLLQNNSV